MLKLYPPGTRKGNRYFIAKGAIDGHEYEVVCRDEEGRKTANRRDAQKFARAFERKVRTEGPLRPAKQPLETFAEVIDAYARARQVSRNEERYLERLKSASIKSAGKKLGGIAIGDVLPFHIAEAANVLYPKCTNETKNRQAYTPAAAVLHFAAENRLRDYMVIKKLPEKKPETRRPKEGVGRVLLANTEGDQHLLLLILFCQGWRITETLGLRESKINLRDRTVEIWVPKAKIWQTLHLHSDVVTALGNRLPIGRPDDRVFPWRHRQDVYRWLRPLCKKLNVKFTPHMARHEFGGALRSMGAHPRDIADAGTWLSEKSTMRYSQAPERAKSLLRKLKVGSKGRGKAGESP